MQEYCVDQLMGFLSNKAELDRTTYLKCKFGAEILIINTLKMLIVYSIAILVGYVEETIIFHLSFMFLRTFSYGYHDASSIRCTLESILVFVVIPFLLTKNPFPVEFMYLLSVVNFMITCRFAPRVTAKNKLNHSSRNKQLRFKSILATLITILVASQQELAIMNLMIVGNSVSNLLILPMKGSK